MPLDASIKNALVIGSGPIVIGQAAEFDYAGAQACRALKQAGVRVSLINPNPATIMTDSAMADSIYLEPLTARTLKRVILREKPDSLLCGLGGQTGLTLAMELYKEGFLQAHGVKLLGANAEAIDRAEDRLLFKQTMEELGQPVIPSRIAVTHAEAMAAADEIGYPIIIRPAFTLGGSGGGVARDRHEMQEAARVGLAASPIHQILVEKYIYGWKEIEFEVMRDAAGNAITVCSMENFDPVGVHTGDSIVIAPAVTLANPEYQMLRSAALAIIQKLKVVGGCNVQFALDPHSAEYAVIEVNPRVSRSSALASKATGYPIAKVSAKLALGYLLPEIQNEITGQTCACFEPAIDYVVVKLPKWPFDKFVYARRALGTQMKATGEVMAIAPTFEMALMKAVRSAENHLDSLSLQGAVHGDIRDALREATDIRLYVIFEALKRGMSVQEIADITRVDRWFIDKIKRLADYEMSITQTEMDEDDYALGRALGYTDTAMMRISGHALPAHYNAAYKMVDTCGAEFDAQTPYFYSTDDMECESRALSRTGKPRVLVLGSGPIRIGQGIEFDYSSVHCVWALKAMGYEVIIANNNPETVSTDFDTADRLYFEPLTGEDVLDIIRVEQPEGVVVAFGGQTAINLARFLDRHGVRILGTSAEGIDIAEDRARFDELLRELNIARPESRTALTEQAALQAASELAYPVLLRPSYVIGGQNMTIAHSDDDVREYMRIILSHPIENPVLVDKYMMGPELEVDVISDGEDVLLPGIMQHIERAGVHSGDSIAVYPPYNLPDRMITQIVRCSTRLALALGTRGLVNIQYLIYQGVLHVIEVNPRASRTVPYLSKVTGIPMVDVAARVMLGQKLADMEYGVGLAPVPSYVTCKAPVFSYDKLSDVSFALGPEMKSTGEVLGIGRTLAEALFKAMCAAGFNLSAARGTGALVSLADEDKDDLPRITQSLLDLDMDVYATPGTARALAALGVTARVVPAVSADAQCEDGESACERLIRDGSVRLVLVTGCVGGRSAADFVRLQRAALPARVICLSSPDTACALLDSLRSGYTEDNTELVNLARLRAGKRRVPFVKMHTLGNDYIYLNAFDAPVDSPESLCVPMCDRHTGVGADGLIVVEPSEIADARMRVYNRDGSEGGMAGNSIRCVGKLLYDRGLARRTHMRIETASGIKDIHLLLYGGEPRAIAADMGAPIFEAARVPVLYGAVAGDEPRELKHPELKHILKPMSAEAPLLTGIVPFPTGEREVFCLSMGNPHCVMFLARGELFDVAREGAAIEHSPLFPERANVSFARVLDARTVRLRVWERGIGETRACGTAACAAVACAVERGLCPRNEDITVKLPGGDMTVRCNENGLTLTGSAETAFEGVMSF